MLSKIILCLANLWNRVLDGGIIQVKFVILNIIDQLYNVIYILANLIQVPKEKCIKRKKDKKKEQ